MGLSFDGDSPIFASQEDDDFLNIAPQNAGLLQKMKE